MDIGPITVKKLFSAIRTPKNILAASLKDLHKVRDIEASKARVIRECDSWALVDQEIGKIVELGSRLSPSTTGPTRNPSDRLTTPLYS